MEQKNLLLAVVLSIAFIFVWSVFVVPRFTPKPLQTPPTQTTATADASSTPAEIVTPKGRQAISHDDVFFRDERNEIALSPLGGGIKSWRLKLKGQEIDLVEDPTASPLPLSGFPNAEFRIAQKGEQATWTGTVQKNLLLTKQLTLNPEGYLHDLIFRFRNESGQPIEVKDWDWGWGPGVGTAPTEKKENSRLIRALNMGKLKAHTLKPGTYTDFESWAGIDNRYHLIAFLPVAVGHPDIVVNGTKDETRVSLRESFTVPAHGEITRHYQIYAGPKGYTQLKKYGKNLEHAVDFGTFSAIGKFILSAIYKLKGWTGNYGWAIVILTIALQLLLFPLTIKSFKATLAMKKLQPQIAAMQQQYKSDPKRLNIEMMNLYKKTGTNPFGGCLPMILQLPIFWALFTTLRNAYELRGAPWILWIKDLSAADPLHILPIIMGGAMFFQQRMGGAITDPTQRQMMFIMPIMFTVMFFNFPAGLVLYWLTNSLLVMGIQYAFQRSQKK